MCHVLLSSDCRAEHIMRQKLSQYLRILDSSGICADIPEGPYANYKWGPEFRLPSESDDYQALLNRLGINNEYCQPPYAPAPNCHDNQALDHHGDYLPSEEVVLLLCNHRRESSQSEQPSGSQPHDLQIAVTLACCDGRWSMNDMADDATTTSGSYMVDMDDVKSETEDTGEKAMTV